MTCARELICLCKADREVAEASIVIWSLFDRSLEEVMECAREPVPTLAATREVARDSLTISGRKTARFWRRNLRS